MEETRRVVTVVFTDLKDSTVLGAELDPETVREVMARYFDEMRGVLERHGGTVEKFIGDAVMAVFGMPVAHEDDALRAVRAAVEMREQLDHLNTELNTSWGIVLSARTGVNTGEVLAGVARSGHSFLAGDAINTAARLEQFAEPGEILVGEPTYRLVHAAVSVERLAPLTLKGKSAPVPAVRLIAVEPSAPGWIRRLDSRLVGREDELVRLINVFDAALTTHGPQVVTVVGAAGVGKSRLSVEFLSRLPLPATVISGRCLPYGEGITFWPIVEAVRAAAGISDRASPETAARRMTEFLSDDEAAVIRERLAPLLGLAAARPGIQDTFWAVRKLFERLAADRPLIVVFDDIQWGEATFLDLLEYLADWIRDVPVLVLCLARPELLEVRPGWMAGKPDATIVRLEPLTTGETDGLIRDLLGADEILREARTRIAQVAEGNPLFVGEVLRMLADDGVLERRGDGWAVIQDLSDIAIPPTIQALLAARLDRLGTDERAVIGRASVIGRVFWWQEIHELSPPYLRDTLTQQLHTLTRKELIEPDYTTGAQEDTFRFTHILIRDAAYRGLPKAERADLHERFAAWMERSAREHLGEYEEIRGYHIEQAYRALRSLGPASDRTDTLARRASATLAEAGGRAFGRGDMPAAVSLLSRAEALAEATTPTHSEVLLQLAFALLEIGDFQRLNEVLAQASVTAEARDDTALRTHVAILRLWERLSTDPEGWADEARAEAEQAIANFDAVGDERGLARGWSLLGLVHNMNAHFGPAEDAWSQAAEHARLAGEHREELECLSWVPLMVLAGPTHVDEGLLRCRAVVDAVDGDKKAIASALTAQAVFIAGLGRFDEARDLIGQARELLREMGLTVWLAGPHAQFAGWIELVAGDPHAAESELRWGYAKLREIGEVGWLSTVVALLAEAVYADGRYDEADDLSQISADAAGTEDIYSQVMWRSVRAKVLAHRGRLTNALDAAVEATTLAGTTDFLHLRWHAHLSCAEVCRLAGDSGGAESNLREAMSLARQKGSVVTEARAERTLGEIHR